MQIEIVVRRLSLTLTCEVEEKLKSPIKIKWEENKMKNHRMTKLKRRCKNQKQKTITNQMTTNRSNDNDLYMGCLRSTDSNNFNLSLLFKCLLGFLNSRLDKFFLDNLRYKSHLWFLGTIQYFLFMISYENPQV